MPSPLKRQCQNCITMTLNKNATTGTLKTEQSKHFKSIFNFIFMSHQLSMSVLNKSVYAIKNFSVSHVWDDHTNNLSGEDLAIGESSSTQMITSGYTQFDWYTVQVTFADANNTSKTMDFYCNSSYSQNKVVLEIYSSHLNCRYYNKKTGNYETGCLDKGWT